MQTDPRKIAIVGPESTGKTTLAQQLAEKLHTVWVPEYAREYLEQLERPYERKDLIDMAKGQLALERNLLSKAQKYLICDTNFLVIKIWSEFKYGTLDPLLEELSNLNSFDLHFLTYIDLPWTFDPQRENPDLEDRARLFELYEAQLKQGRHSYHVLKGNQEDRLQAAMDILEEI